MEGMINAYKILDRRPEGKRPLGRLRRRDGDNIKMELKQGVIFWTGYNGLRIWTNGKFL
jgi:hypothetical protein